MLGKDYAGPGTFQADGRNPRPFCGDANPNCHGDSHTDGEVWLGAAWKVRQNLKNSQGDALGSVIADTLFLSWMEAFDQTELKSIIEKQWLILDDLMDDGQVNLCKPPTAPTPHFAEIDLGFRAQGFPGFPGPDDPLCLPL